MKPIIQLKTYFQMILTSFEILSTFLKLNTVFWMTNRSVNIKSHLLNIYNSSVDLPRPESYREDKTEISNLSPG